MCLDAVSTTALVDDHLLHEALIRIMREFDEDPSKRPRPDKSQMYRAPAEILGHYCKLDCESTYLLYTKILAPVLEQFETLQLFLEVDWRALTEQLINAKIKCIRIDRDLKEENKKEEIRRKGRLIKLQARGMNLKEIAAIEGVSDRTLRRWLKDIAGDSHN